MTSFSDDVSTGSEPYIFADDSASSITDASSFNVGRTWPATPHIFLSYAQKSYGGDTIRKQLQSVSRIEKKKSSDLPVVVGVNPPSLYRSSRDGKSTAHLFLPYAGSSSRAEQEMDDECIETQAGEDTCETSEMKRSDIKFDGVEEEELLDSFQSRWMEHMTAEHYVPPERAAAVAFALRAAATRTVPENHPPSKRMYSEFEDIIDNIFNGPSTIVDEKETPGHDNSGSPSKRKIVEDNSNETMMYKFGRQEDELSLLRLVLKHLILPNQTTTPDNELMKHPPVINHYSPRSNPVHLVNGYQYYHVHDNVGKQGRVGAAMGIPSFIELREQRDGPPMVDMDMDTLEVASQLTPSIGDFDSQIQIQQHDLLRLASFGENFKMQESSPLPSHSARASMASPIMTQPLRMATSKALDGFRISGTKTQSCLNHSDEVRTEKQPLQSSNCVPSPITDMALGEIRGFHARSVDFSIYLSDAKTLLKGKYSGRIRSETSLPHGPGVFRFDNRDLYIGEFDNGLFHGEGMLLTRRNHNLIKLRGNFHHNYFVGDSLLLQDDSSSDGISV
jgi:hypothetical protein